MKLDADDIRSLQPVIAQVVAETFDRVVAESARFGDRVGFKEAEAAELLGVQRHVLRDCRRRGEIKARQVGKCYVYERGVLVQFLRNGDHKK